MDMSYGTMKQDERRIQMLLLKAESFEEERILRALFEVVKCGGTVEIEHNDGDDVRTVVCAFGEKTDADG